jgi:hypothetical protein
MKKIVILVGVLLVSFLFFMLGTTFGNKSVPKNFEKETIEHEIREQKPRRKDDLNRMRPLNRKFMLRSLSANLKQDQLIIECSFAGSLLNPDSITNNIFVNNHILTNIKTVKFNRMGTVFRIYVEPEETAKLIQQNIITISIKDIQSVNGDPLEYYIEKDITIGKLYVFEEDGTCFVY